MIINKLVGTLKISLQNSLFSWKVGEKNDIIEYPSTMKMLNPIIKLLRIPSLYGNCRNTKSKMAEKTTMRRSFDE
ncbi:MAG: hypothetical protein H5T39_06620 [Methanobacteriales archaeon]|nr:hypothetical protein [Methanobacteriales archaeon]